MPDTLLYAKKLILPAFTANTLQSLNMAAAFGEAGVRTSFFPGIRPTSGGDKKEAALSDLLPGILANYGLSHADITSWKALKASHKGLYSLAYQSHVAARFLRGVDCMIARDVKDALFLARLKKSLAPIAKKKGPFLYEMHEALYAMHQNTPGRHDWRVTMEREKKILRHVDGLILTNGSLEAEARETLGYTGPFIVEPNGFNPALFSPLPLFEADCPWPGANDAVQLVYIGGMHKGKGVAELIQAMATLPERFQLRIVGTAIPSILSEMEELAATIPGADTRIRFLGHVPQTGLRDACAGAHIAIVPQQPHGEYFSPIKLQEYRALGLPVVCTPVDFFIGQGSHEHYAQDFSPAAIAAAAEELANSPDMARRLRDQGLVIAQNYTWVARARRILDFADSL
ncbi:glycosyltransferase family 4 protein [Desulfovibrio sp. OttesenSCG-928-I05]|nr:glycosyltransferase family 4 protein [Desulfovibrio sp. OttesenSCG-928-I05]